jgi:hypothetical protein
MTYRTHLKVLRKVSAISRDGADLKQKVKLACLECSAAAVGPRQVPTQQGLA